MADTYCKYPFREIAIKDYHKDKLKTFWPCCMMGNEISTNRDSNVLGIDNAHELTPQEMYDHPRMQQLRDNLQNGVRDSACKVCWDQEDRGLKSFRQFSNEDLGSTDGLSSIDLVVSNICNLRCRMCTPSSSNQLMADFQYFEKHNLIPKVTSAIKRWSKSVAYQTDDSIQWKWLIENTDKIKLLKASGGEPFYDKKVIGLLKKYVETGSAKNTTLRFHTNATQFNNEIIELINQFKCNKHTFSIDGVEKTYEYIRYPATFNELEISVNNYVNHVKNYDSILNFTMVLSAHNVLNVDDYIRWSKSISKGVAIQFAEIYDKDRGIALKHLPVYLLEKAKQQAMPHLLRPSGKEDSGIVNLIRQIDNAIANNKEDKQIILDESELFDLSRNQNYRDFLHPDLVEWMSSK